SDAAVFGAVPALVGRERLAAANGVLATLASATEIVGPIIAGGLLVVIGSSGVLWIDAASFLLAAAVQSTIRSEFRDGPPPERRRIIDQLRRVRAFIGGERTVGVLLGVGFANSFAFGIVLGLVVPHASLELGIDADDARIGILFAAIGVGSLVTGVAFDRVFAVQRIPVLTPAGLLAAGIAAAIYASVSAWAVAAILLGAFSASIALTIVTGITYRQLAATDDLRSSVNVVGRMIAWGGQPFGAFTGAAIATFSSTVTAIAVGAAIMVLASIAARLLLDRRAEPSC
ncbi:MAG: MFS transporter, partial [Actinomycetota bacterium]